MSEETICSVTRGQEFYSSVLFFSVHLRLFSLEIECVSLQSFFTTSAFHSFHLFFTFVFVHQFSLKFQETGNSWEKVQCVHNKTYCSPRNPYPISRLQKWNGHDDSGMLLTNTDDWRFFKMCIKTNSGDVSDMRLSTHSFQVFRKKCAKNFSQKL